LRLSHFLSTTFGQNTCTEKRGGGGAYQRHDGTATYSQPLSLSLSGPQVLVSRGKRERENGKKFLKGTNRKRRGCREALSQQILVECVSCRQAASASATPRDDERIERGEAAGSRSPTSAGTLLCFCTTIPAALTLPLMLSSPASPMAPCETDQLPKASSCSRVSTRGCWAAGCGSVGSSRADGAVRSAWQAGHED
jgi:hypothetical protein